MNEIQTRDRFRGCLLGLAVGDALGTTLEFKKPGTFEPLTDMIGGGPFHLNAGEWTDDTSIEWMRWARSTQPFSLSARGGRTKRRMPCA